jgi:hypothetical protein
MEELFLNCARSAKECEKLERRLDKALGIHTANIELLKPALLELYPTRKHMSSTAKNSLKLQIREIDWTAEESRLFEQSFVDKALKKFRMSLLNRVLYLFNRVMDDVYGKEVKKAKKQKVTNSDEEVNLEEVEDEDEDEDEILSVPASAAGAGANNNSVILFF